MANGICNDSGSLEQHSVDLKPSTGPSHRDYPMPTPYLALTVPEAAVLRDPPAPEPRSFDTVIHLLDHRANHSADQTAVGFPSCPQDGVKDGACLRWTYRDLQVLSRRMAHSLRLALGAPETLSEHGKQPVVAVLAPSGPEFLLHTVAAWRLGMAILPIALGTTASGAASLIESTGCKRLLYHKKQEELAREVESIIASHNPGDGWSLSRWTDLGVVMGDASGEEAEPLRKSEPEDVLVIFHSSGSTGNPKPIPQLVRFWTSSLLTAAGREFAAYTTTPLYHGGLSDLFRALQAAAPIYFFPWHEAKGPTSDNIMASLRSCPETIRYFLSVPFILEMLSKDSQGLAMMQKMDLVSTGGAPLPEEVGDTLTTEHRVRLVSRMGSSECGFLMSSWRDFETEKDWSWLRRPKEADEDWIIFEGQEEEQGIFELVVQARWPTKLLSNRKNGQFATGDLYEQHQSHRDRWRYSRRADDAIVMVNGKKIASAAVESRIKATGLVDHVIVFGANRPLLGAIVSPSAKCRANGAGELELLSKFSAPLRAINSELPSHARIPIEMIHVAEERLFSDMPRSSKGTLQRGLALQALSPLIDKIYARFEDGSAPSVEPRRSLEKSQLQDWLQNLVEEMTGRKLAPQQDFFENGVDSIMAARIRAAVHQRIDMGGRKLRSNVVYENPTLKMLSAHILQEESLDQDDSSTSLQSSADAMIARHAAQTQCSSAQRVASPTKNTILLTGATGALGARIVEQLTHSPDVESIVCVVRAGDDQNATQRLSNSLRDRQCEVDSESFDAKILTVKSLNAQVKDTLQRASKLVVIHCAWIVNFALRLESFEKECVAPLEELLKLYSSSDNPSRFVFCSSIASIMAGKATHKEVPSTNIADAGTTGYGQSKWVAERICESYGKDCGIITARVGQLCGDAKHGIWNETEAWPLLVRTANETGMLPENGPDVDWLPVDVAARAVIDLALARDVKSPIAHVALPPQVPRLPWSRFLDGLEEAGLQFQRVPKSKWLQAVKEAGTRVRGRSLLSIWEKLPEGGEEPTVVTSDAESASPTLSQAKAIDAELCAKFVKVWQSTNFLT